MGKYEEALERAKKRYITELTTSVEMSMLEYIFPELKESEDERIRKEVLAFIRREGQHIDKYKWHKWIAWLEKQHVNPFSGVSFEYNGHHYGMCARDNGVEILFDGELKAFVSSEKSFVYPIHPQPDLAPKNVMEAIKEEKVDNQNCVKPIVEPKFKVGDWTASDTNLIRRIIKVENGYYTTDYGILPIEDYDNVFHLWSIYDAKDGDVLTWDDTSCVVLFEGVKNNKCFTSHCFANDISFEICTSHYIEGCHPATKEQRDLLFQNMKEAGYEWDAEKKELKKIEQKHTPKYKVGDWVIHQGTENIYQVVAIIDNQYQLKYGDTYTIQNCVDVDRCARLWDITKDAKNGDVLFCTGDIKDSNGIKYERICLFNNLDNAFFILTKLSNFVEECDIDVNIDYPDNTVPATKEQKEILFMAMKGAGYEWDSEKKELKKIEWTPQPGDTFRKKGTKSPIYHLCNRREDGIHFGFVEERECGVAGGDISIFTLKDEYELVEPVEKVIDEEFNKFTELNSSWSEEDEITIKDICDKLSCLSNTYVGNQSEICLKEIDWLKSLRSKFES